ncbi:type II toxin-antitoxin system death-on-curing family toxin [Thiospirillum jenense]|uniref:Type II toxin-antitoxin system death-on-curing family toxin n=2 Tax=Thiospirillum jenense TaxID=1653858 RepID=A0A839HHE9_9GAMM|nr:type II toxin-antitoxin system death-on-curing family toxin [Thiospirillum jenense]MBB1125642.1 type II toxin-antitoxin system death-on-curing family toxin [Thiospirillum jenense]
MIAPQWVLDEVVISVHRMLIAMHGGSQGIRDVGLLESALMRPRQLYYYEPQSTVFDLAAAYGFGLVKNHPFVDGNKRVALAIAAIFLEINGFSLDAPDIEAVSVIEQLAASHLSESDLAKWLGDLSKPIV